MKEWRALPLGRRSLPLAALLVSLVLLAIQFLLPGDAGRPGLERVAYDARGTTVLQDEVAVPTLQGVPASAARVTMTGDVIITARGNYHFQLVTPLRATLRLDSTTLSTSGGSLERPRVRLRLRRERLPVRLDVRTPAGAPRSVRLFWLSEQASPRREAVPACLLIHGTSRLGLSDDTRSALLRVAGSLAVLSVCALLWRAGAHLATVPRAQLFASLAYSLVFLVGTLPVWMGWRVPHWDAAVYFAPRFGLVSDFARQGKVLLWDPWVNGGSPDYVDPQVGATAPTTVGLGFVLGGTMRAFCAYWLMIWWLAGFGLIVLGTELGAPWWGAGAGALGFAFSGVLLGQAQHTSHVHSLAFVGLVLWRLEVAMRQRNLWPAVQAGALWGCSGLAGYPGLTLLHAGFALAWIGIGWANARRDVRPLWVAKASVIFLGSGALVLLAVHGAFSVEALGYSDRATALPRTLAIDQDALHPMALLNLASPYLMTLRHADPRLWPYTDVTMSGLYCGALLVVLATCSLVVGGMRSRLLLAIGAAFLACALGRALPFRGWLYDYLPPFRLFKHAAIFRDYFVLTLDVAGMLASRALLALPATRKPRSIRWIAGLVGASGITSALVVMGHAARWGPLTAVAAAQAIVVWTGSAVGVGWLASGGRDRGVLALVMGVTLLDAVGAAWLCMSLVGGLGGQAKTGERVSRLEPVELKRVLTWAPAGGGNGNIDAKVAILDSYSPFWSRFHMGSIRSPAVSAMALGERRFWFSATAPEVPWSDASFSAFRRRVERRGPTIVIHSPRRMGRLEVAGASAEAMPDAAPIDISVIRSSASVLKFRCEAPSPGWLLVTERWAAGWGAWVDGASVPIWGGNFIFRAIRIDGGVHRIVMAYRPYGYPWFIIVSWGAMIAVAATSLWKTLGSRRGARHRRIE